MAWIVAFEALASKRVGGPWLGIWLLGPVPVLAFFSPISLDTHGGYFLVATPMSFIAAARASRRPGNCSILWLVLFLAAGQYVLVSFAMDKEPEGRLAAWGKARLNAVSELVPRPAVIVSADLSMQLVSGRLEGLLEKPLWAELLAASRGGHRPGEFSERVAAALDGSGADHWLALDLNWAPFGVRGPGLEAFMEALESRLAADSRWTTRVHGASGMRFPVRAPERVGHTGAGSSEGPPGKTKW